MKSKSKSKSAKHVDPERSAAMKGNKNAKGKRVISSNVGGFVSGVLNPKSANSRNLSVYEKRGAGKTGYKAGMLARRVLTLGTK